jgi:hypothetical protein
MMAESTTTATPRRTAHVRSVDVEKLYADAQPSKKL